MKSKPWGQHFINVTSIAGSRVHPFAGVAYATFKAPLSGVTREMAYDCRHHGIRINATAPGEINTPIYRQVPKRSFHDK